MRIRRVASRHRKAYDTVTRQRTEKVAAMQEMLMNRLVASVATLVLTIATQLAWAANEKFPGKGLVTIGTGPIPLFVHYLDGSGKPAQVELRNIHYAKPELARSKELAVLAKSPCGTGDVVNIKSSAIGAEATGVDAAGIGRVVWLLSGQYTTDGQRWQFQGAVRPKDDRYDFNMGRDGERAFWAEVSTRLGAAFRGKEFNVQIQGSLPVSISGVCSLDSAGKALV